MTRTQLAVIAVILGIVVAVTIFHAGQYTYIRVFFGCDAPFEDFTSFSGLYYWVNGLVDFFRDIITTLKHLDITIFEDGSFNINGCLEWAICTGL